MPDVEKINKTLEVSPAFSRDYFSGGDVKRAWGTNTSFITADSIIIRKTKTILENLKTEGFTHIAVSYRNKRSRILIKL